MELDVAIGELGHRGGDAAQRGVVVQPAARELQLHVLHCGHGRDVVVNGVPPSSSECLDKPLLGTAPAGWKALPPPFRPPPVRRPSDPASRILSQMPTKRRFELSEKSSPPRPPDSTMAAESVKRYYYWVIAFPLSSLPSNVQNRYTKSIQGMFTHLQLSVKDHNAVQQPSHGVHNIPYRNLG